MSKKPKISRAKDLEGFAIPWARPEELAYLPLRGPVVLVNGAFDLLHPTHMRLLWAAREAGETVICALDTDEKIAAEKGEGRPILSFPERAAALNYMPINLIVPIGSRADMDLVMKHVDLRVQGDGYAGKRSRYPAVPKLFVRSSGLHTSTIIERILSRCTPPKNS